MRADHCAAVLAFPGAFFAVRFCSMLPSLFLTLDAPSAGASAPFLSELLIAPLLPVPLLAGVPGLPDSFGFAGPGVPAVCAKLNGTATQSAKDASTRRMSLVNMMFVS